MLCFMGVSTIPEFKYWTKITHVTFITRGNNVLTTPIIVISI